MIVTVFGRAFNALSNQMWLADLTHIRIAEGWFWVSVVPDVFRDRRADV